MPRNKRTSVSCNWPSTRPTSSKENVVDANSQIPNLPLDFARRSGSTAMTWPRIRAMTRGWLRWFAARLARQSARGMRSGIQTSFYTCDYTTKRASFGAFEAPDETACTDWRNFPLPPHTAGATTTSRWLTRGCPSSFGWWKTGQATHDPHKVAKLKATLFSQDSGEISIHLALVFQTSLGFAGYLNPQNFTQKTN